MDYGARIAEHSDRLEAFGARDQRGGRAPASARRPRTTLKRARLITDSILLVGALIAVTITFGIFSNIVGGFGLYIVAALMLGALLLLAFRPAAAGQRPISAFKEDMPNQAVVDRLGRFLSRRRAALPAAAALRVDAIKAQLPLLESRLGELNPLDPLAADARRLMGQHLPELIERYERVPAPYRRERDGDGMSVDQRLVAGLDAACNAIEEMSRDLTEKDRAEFETQGRFIESRYAADGPAETR